MSTSSSVFCALILLLRAATTAAAEEPAHVAHEEHPEANSEPTESERAHVAPDPPQHPMHEMSSERMIELMQMEDNAPFSMLLFDELEWHERNNEDAVHWDAQAWYGTDYSKAWLRSEGNRVEGEYEGLAELLWDRIVARWWHAQAGVRHDFGEGPSRDWIGFGFQGLAPHWFEVEATIYFGEQGRTAARFSGEVELLLTQRLVLQPKIEFDLYGKDDPENASGSGLADSEIGLRLRYEIRREIAPYVGLVWTRSYGDTADFARRAGDDVDELRFVAGLRLWF
jgi:copper resistance protein B